MSTDSPSPAPRLSLLRNWLSLTGLVVMAASVFSFLLLFALDLFAHNSNPYVGILTYFVAPAILVGGAVLTVAGMLWERRQIRKAGGQIPLMVVNLSRPRDRKIFGIFLACSGVFLLFAALGSYHTYHFTESTTFCGQACHTVMQPEMDTYVNGAHARVSCTQCHIGPGATWWVKSKLSGTYQVYATLMDKYPRPIPTPVHNLRPAQETCEQCHWPKKFVGNLERTYTYFLGDETNSLHTIRMLMKVGGADPSHGPLGGIHWHMNVGNKVEYIATDKGRQKIPWVRVTTLQGAMTEFRTPSFTNDPAALSIRTMDCMDCHNRPAHVLKAPNNAVNLAMSLGQIDPSLPYIKTNALYVLTRPYATTEQALKEIATALANRYTNAPTDPRLLRSIDAIQGIYTNNFFPAMKANWRTYPNNIGHKDWPGCTRCHDDKHIATNGSGRRLGFSECSTCHILLAQGAGEALNRLDGNGQPFKHPGDELDPSSKCDECHNGGL
jgi:nitrate/TMAO reductase-like tetraheme cytochrome c subunit